MSTDFLILIVLAVRLKIIMFINKLEYIFFQNYHGIYLIIHKLYLEKIHMEHTFFDTLNNILKMHTQFYIN